MLLRVFKISGHSMMPTLKPNDKVLVSSIPYYISPPKVGDIVVFKYGKKFLIKKIAKIEKERYLVEGENKDDSLKIGKIERSDIVGKVIRKIWI